MKSESRKVVCPFKFKVGVQQAEKAKLPKSSCQPHNVAATRIKTKLVLDGGPNPPLSKSQAMARQLTQRKQKTQPC